MALKEVKNLQKTILIIPGLNGESSIMFAPKEKKKIEITSALEKAQDMGYVRIGYKSSTEKKVDTKSVDKLDKK